MTAQNQAVQKNKQAIQNNRNDIEMLKTKEAIRDKKDAIDKCKNKYKAGSPSLYGIKLVESLRKLYVENMRIWPYVIRHMGSAYSRAHEKFNHIKNIHDQHAETRRKMAANVVATFAGAGLGWYGAGLQALKDLADSEERPKSVEAYFSSGFKSIVKNSGIEFGAQLPEVKYDPKQNMKLGLPVNVLANPTEFQNQLMNSFKNCCDQVIAQFDNMIKQFENQYSKANESLRKQFGNFEEEADNPNVPADNLIPRLDGAYDKVKNMVRLMNEHLVRTAYYFNHTPDFPVKEWNHKFVHLMSYLLERALWAGWIPDNLTSRSKSRPMYSRGPWKGMWRPGYDSPSVYTKLEPGYYACFNCGPGMANAVKIDMTYIDPSTTLVDRLEQLQIIKTKEGGPIDKEALTRDQIAQVENLGWWIQDSDVKMLLAWARQENQKLSPYALSKFPYVKRKKQDELWLKQLL